MKVQSRLAAAVIAAALCVIEARAQTVIAGGAQPLTVPDRTLLDQVRRPVRVRSLFSGGPLILSFTYTGCLSVCPVSDLIMNGVEDVVRRRGGARIGLATLTMDPLNDTPEMLAARADAIGSGPGRRWLTGSPDDVFPVLDALGVKFGRVEDHESFFLVVDPSGRMALRVRIDQANPDSLVDAANALR